MCAAREQQHVLEELCERSGYLLHVVLRSLRGWSRAAEAHERLRTGMLPVAVSEQLYAAVLGKVCLAMMAEPTRAEIAAQVSAAPTTHASLFASD